MKPKIDMMELGKQVTMTVKLTNVWQFDLRYTIAMLILRLFIWVMPVNVVIEDLDE